MGTKMAVSFANIFMEKIETEILRKSAFKPTVWKRYIDDIFSLWEISKPDIEAFTSNKKIHITQLSNSRPISLTLETMFLHTVIYKGNRFKEQSVLVMNTHFKPTETFQYTHFTSCHPPSHCQVLIKGPLESAHSYNGQFLLCLLLLVI